MTVNRADPANPKCKGKVRFRSKKRALARAEEIAVEGSGDRLVPYRCTSCGSHHFHTADDAPRRTGRRRSRGRPPRTRGYDDEEEYALD